MKKIEVRLQFYPHESVAVGTLGEENRRLFFQYDAKFLNSPLWLSPFKLPLEPGVVEHKDRSFGPVFGLFDDSMPDGWGLLLMDRYFRRIGIASESISVLDRLSYMGSHAMGALTYHPPLEDEDNVEERLNLHDMARASYQVLSGDVQDVLPQLLRAGGSPGGARPKVLIGLKGDSIISGETDLPDGYAHWLVKFFSREDHNDEGRVEYAYSLMARNAGVRMPATQLFITEEGSAYFGVERFDRRNNRRLHTHTFGNMIHSNFRIPNCDYDMLLRATRILTKNHDDVVTAFRLMVFNILAHNRDDHVKNFSFTMDHDGTWHFAPAYDLTYSAGPGGEHSMTVAGEGRSPGRADILKLAAGAGLRKKEVADIIDEVAAAVSQWKKCAEIADLSRKRAKQIDDSIQIALKDVL